MTRSPSLTGDDLAGARAPSGNLPRHLLHIFPSFGVGGIQVRFARVANHLGSGYRHTVVGLDGNSGCLEKFNRDVSIKVVPIQLKGFGLASRVRRIRAFVSATAPDLLLTYNWGSVEWALANLLFPLCREVHFEDGFGPEEAEHQLLRRVLMRRLALARVARVVVPSRNLERIARDIWRLDPAKVDYQPNGVDVSRYSAAANPGLLPGFSKRPDEVVVGTVAPLRAEKNIARLVRAFAMIPLSPSVRLMIVGDGAERPRLQQIVGDLGLADRVHFAGHSATPERILPLFDVFAISSDTEQMPLTVLEAMAAGLPVAGVDVGDVRSMLSVENRELVVPKQDVGALARSIERLVMDASMRRRLGRLNREHVGREFSETRMFQAYDEIFSL